MTIDRPPNVVAMASALGMIIGFSPFIGFQTLAAIGFSYFFRLPVYPLILGAYVTNPFTMVFIYAFCYKVGIFITDVEVIYNLDWSNMTLSIIIHNLKQFFYPLLIGCTVVGAIVAAITYIVVYYIVKKYKEVV